MTTDTSKPDEKDAATQPQDAADEAAIWNEFEASDALKDETPPEPGRDELLIAEEPASPAATEEPVKTPEEPQPVTTEIDPSVWSDPDKARQAYEALRDEKSKVEQKLKSDVGRQTALQNRIRELQKVIQKPAKAGEQDHRKAIDTLKEDYPEVAGPVSQALDAVASRVDELSQQEQGRHDAAQQELDAIVNEQTRQIDESRPGWGELLNSNAAKFKEWIEDQPMRMRANFVRNHVAIVDADAAIEIVDAFKSFMNPPAPALAPQAPPLNDRRQRQLAGSSTPNRTGRAPVVSGIPQDGDEQAIWDAFEAQDAAKARR